ncbi:MAG: hypothetical protein V1754_05860 [Pseudomonadota bacterium]
MYWKTGVIVLGMIFLSLGCSGDAPSFDLGVDAAVYDFEKDLEADSAQDLKKDGYVEDISDAISDISNDSELEDSGADLSVLDGTSQDSVIADVPLIESGVVDVGIQPTPSVWGFIRRSISPVFDGKGDLHIGLYDPIFPPPLPPTFGVANTVITGADFSVGAQTVKYELFNAPSGNFVLWAFLDDNANAIPFLALPDPGDLEMASTVGVTIGIGTGPTRKDLVLNRISGSASADGGVPDAVVTVGDLQGKVTRTVAPALDGKGNIYVSVHSVLPPNGLVNYISVYNANLSSPFASVGYFFSGVEEGNYYLRVFLDDNGNANIFAPAPDSGDLVHSMPIPVHVIAGTTNMQNVVLDKVQQ